jgi:NADH:ubiquinone oxidoreductase subunit 2 (subunit N)
MACQMYVVVMCDIRMLNCQEKPFLYILYGSLSNLMLAFGFQLKYFIIHIIYDGREQAKIKIL